MWRVSVKDLLHRKRRFVIAVLATSIALGLSLVMNGLLQHLRNENARMVNMFDADVFVVSAGGTGPFTTYRLLPQTVVDEVRGQPGVTRADAFVQARDQLKGKDVNVVGITIGGLGSPTPKHGRLPQADGEVAVDTTLGYDVGDHLQLGGHDFTVVGETANTTYYFGTPTVFATIPDVQRSFFDGQPYVTAVAVQGTATPPEGATVFDKAATRKDLDRPAASGAQTIWIMNGLLWILAAGVVAAMVYIAALERMRDIAVLRAIGTSDATLFSGLVLQGLVLSAAACAAGLVVAFLIKPTFPFAVEIPLYAFLLLPIIAVGMASIASLVALRRAVKVDPALAFGG
jgi:putative ABC transport system permease protein